MDDETMMGIDGVFKVVEEKDLESATLDGWRLVRALPSTKIMGSRNEPASINNGQYTTVHDRWVTEYGMTHHFLLRKGVTLLIGELNNKLNAQAHEASERIGEIDTLKRQNAKAATEVANAASRQKEAVDAWHAADDTVKQQRGQLRKLETDLAKVRKEIGDKEFSRITGPEPF